MPSVKHARQSFNHAQEIAAATDFEAANARSTTCERNKLWIVSQKEI